MSIMSNIAGAAGFSMGNITRNALKFVGLPEGVASAVGLVMDVKNGNIGSALFKTGPALLQALTGGQAGQANSVDRPSSVLGTIAKVAGFAALGLGGAALVGTLGGASVASTALGGLSGMTKGILGIVGALGFTAIGGGVGKTLFGLAGLGAGGGINEKTAFGASRTQGGLGSGSALNALPTPAMFEDIVAAMMIDFVKDAQNGIGDRLEKLRQNAQNAGKTNGDKVSGAIEGGLNSLTGGASGEVNKGKDAASAESRNIDFEMLKNDMQKLSQMQQAMSGVLNSMNDTAMNAIRKVSG